MNKNWSDIAWEDYLALQSDKKLLKKVSSLITTKKAAQLCRFLSLIFHFNLCGTD